MCVCLEKSLFHLSVCKALLLGREFWVDRILFPFSVLDTGLHCLLTYIYNGKSSIHLFFVLLDIVSLILALIYSPYHWL